MGYKGTINVNLLDETIHLKNENDISISLVEKLLFFEKANKTDLVVLQLKIENIDEPLILGGKMVLTEEKAEINGVDLFAFFAKYECQYCEIEILKI